jgi:hypothetical protein
MIEHPTALYQDTNLKIIPSSSSSSTLTTWKQTQDHMEELRQEYNNHIVSFNATLQRQKAEIARLREENERMRKETLVRRRALLQENSVTEKVAPPENNREKQRDRIGSTIPELQDEKASKIIRSRERLRSSAIQLDARERPIIPRVVEKHTVKKEDGKLICHTSVLSKEEKEAKRLDQEIEQFTNMKNLYNQEEERESMMKEYQFLQNHG